MCLLRIFEARKYQQWSSLGAGIKVGLLKKTLSYFPMFLQRLHITIIIHALSYLANIYWVHSLSQTLSWVPECNGELQVWSFLLGTCGTSDLGNIPGPSGDPWIWINRLVLGVSPPPPCCEAAGVEDERTTLVLDYLSLNPCSVTCQLCNLTQVS